MDLTEKKRFKNLNGYADGKWLHGPSQQSLDGTVTTGVNFVGSAMKSFGPVKSSGDILQESGTSTAQGGGFTFLQLNPIDEGAQMSEVGKENTANTLQTAAAGAAAGAMFGPIGAAAGGVLGGVIGLFGGARRKSKMAELIKKALILRVKNNNFSFSSGQSDYLAQLYNVEHDYTQDDLIYSAKDGMSPVNIDNVLKQSGFVKEKGKYVFDGRMKVSNGEIYGHVDDYGNAIDARQAGKGVDNNDSLIRRAGYTPEEVNHTFVLSNKPERGINGIAPSTYAKMTKDIEGAIAMQDYSKQNMNKQDYTTIKLLRYGSFDKLNGGLMYAKNGKLPGFADGNENKSVISQSIIPINGKNFTFTAPDVSYVKAKWPQNKYWESPTKIEDIRRGVADDPIDGIRKQTTELPTDTSKWTNPDDWTLKKGKLVQRTGSGDDNWYSDSNLSNAITSGMGILGGLSQMMQANNQKLNKPDVYAGNDYLGRALNVYSYLSPATNRAVREAASTEARNRYNINRMGGLSGAQKYLATVQSGIGLQNNISNIYMDANKERNSYLSQYANAALNGGNAEAQRRQTANQYLDEAYARSNAAKLQMSQMGMQNMLAAFYQYYKNLEKNNRFMRTMSYYDQDYDLRRRELQKGL